MKYLIADALPARLQCPNAILIIPITNVLTSVLIDFSSRVDSFTESMRPVMTGQLQGFLMPSVTSGKKAQKSIDSFRRLLKNELNQNEFAFLEESSILNEGILDDLAERFILTIDVLESSTIFQKLDGGRVEYTTYSIPLACMSVSTIMEIPNQN